MFLLYMVSSHSLSHNRSAGVCVTVSQLADLHIKAQAYFKQPNIIWATEGGEWGCPVL